MNARNFKTKQGTDLPLLNLRGKDYLEVKYRLVWFREDHPDWSIETDLLSVTDVSAYAKATVRDESGRVIATSHKFESVKGFPDFIEKAETGAIGRALALIGYGTQFCADELDEGNRIVDAPVQSRGGNARSARPGAERLPARGPSPAAAAARYEAANLEVSPTPEAVNAAPAQEQVPMENAENVTAFHPGDYVISFGRKYKGRKLSDIPRAELESYLTWLEGSASQEGKPVSHQVKYLRTAYDRLCEEGAAH